MTHPLSLPKIAHPVSLLLAGIIGSIVVVETTLASQSTPQLMQISPSTERVERVNGAAVLAIALVGSAGVGAALTVMHNRKHPATQRAQKQSQSLKTNNPRLQRKLMRLLHDDRRVAERLITQIQFKYPGKTPDWYLEKVIYDLERDRH